jgi:FkbM family methyltransferase
MRPDTSAEFRHPRCQSRVSGARMKKLLRWLTRTIQPVALPAAPGRDRRPISDVKAFLEDIRARGFGPRGIVDVGANAGHWTRMALSVFPGVPSILIEPQHEMEPALASLVAENPGCAHVKAGAGRVPGEMVQTIWEDRAGSSFLPHVTPEGLAAGTQRMTPIVTIDGLMRDAFPAFHPDLVKLDIQGFELEALAGGQSLFGRTEVFIVETSLFRFLPAQPITREIIAFMADRSYELYDITEHLRRPRDGALGQVDCAFVKARGMFRKSDAW